MKLACWHCGDRLEDVPRPIRSQMRCPQCRSNLHACRMCRHYDMRYIGHCSHDDADRVLDKEAANYCTYYTPNPHAYGSERDNPAEHAQSELRALFGASESEDNYDEGSPDKPASSQERAKREAESLFDFGTRSEDKDKS